MGSENSQDKVGRVRPPRVHITYDVQTDGAFQVKELPFVMGVVGDFTGQPEQQQAALRDRKFVEINPDNFDAVLEKMQPHLAFSVKNTLTPSEGQLGVNLHFKTMDDFSPDKVAGQIGPLKDLLDLRTQLSSLRGALQGNDKLDDLLKDVVKNTDTRSKLEAQLVTGEKAHE